VLVKFSIRLIPVLALLMAWPRTAHAYVDPGTGSIIWQLSATTVIGCAFYVRRAEAWMRSHLGFRSQRALGFAFATFYAMLAAPLTVALFNDHPRPVSTTSSWWALLSPCIYIPGSRRLICC